MKGVKTGDEKMLKLKLGCICVAPVVPAVSLDACRPHIKPQ